MQLTAMTVNVPDYHEDFLLPGEGMSLHKQQDSGQVFL